MLVHAQDFNQVLKDQRVNPKVGLSSQEAKMRLAKFGPNTLPSGRKLGLLGIFLRQFKNPLIYILLVAGLVTLALGELSDTAVILLTVSFSALLGFFQEEKAQESVLALQELTSPKAQVLRDGELQELAAAAVVPGDILVLTEGSQVTADARLFEVHELLVDESALTGESTRVRKQVKKVSEGTLTPDQKNMVFAGTNVVGGNGRAVVCATGLKTELGKIAKLVVFGEASKTPLQKDLARFGFLLSVGVLLISALIFLGGVLVGQPPALMFLFGVALAVSVIPEDLIIQVTIALAVAVSRMASRSALARTLPAVEGLGAVTVVAADKTGTLTENRLKVQKLFLDGENYETEHAFESATFVKLLQIAVLCNDASASLGDPLEQALLSFAESKGVDVTDLRNKFPRLLEIPFSSSARLMATVNAAELLVKGAPAEVLRACQAELFAGRIIKLNPKVQSHILHEARRLAEQGLKPLALAFRKLPAGRGKKVGAQVEDLTFVGLVGLADSVRPEVAAAVTEIQQAGVRVLMLTGDHRLTASSIAKAVGIKNAEEVIKGEDLEKLPKTQLKKALLNTNVFARVTPRHKLKLIEVLQEEGEVVAMTGDGVNDAPALRAADIGVAMGQGGTDVARSAADLVLQDNNFATIVAAIEEGRAIFDNLRKVILYLITTNLGEILVVVGGLVYTALFLKEPLLVLYPTQILWLNLATDGLPDNALIFEPREADLLKRPPRSPKGFVLVKSDFARMALFALVMAVGSLILFVHFLPQGLPKARTVTLTVMALFQILNAFNMQSADKSLFEVGLFRNGYLFLAVLVTVIFQVLLVKLPFLMNLFRVVSLDFADWLVVWAFAGSVILAEEARKFFVRRRKRGFS